MDPALTTDSPLTVDPALVVGGAVSGCTAGTTLTVGEVGAAVVVGATLVVVGWGLQALAGPEQEPGGTVGGRTLVDVVDVDVVDVDVDVVVVGKRQDDPSSFFDADPVTPSEPVQVVETDTGPAGRVTEKVCVAPIHVIGVGVPLIVTVAELVPVAGNAE